MERGFEYNASILGKEFSLGEGTESISIGFENGSWMKNGQVKLCFSKKYKTEYDKLVQEVKTKGNKLSFFFSSSYNLYMTEYSIGSTYVYVCKGLCMSLDKSYKFGSLVVTNYEAEHLK